MILTIQGKKANITKELQDMLIQNSAKKVKKAVFSKRKDKNGDFLQEEDENGVPKFINATIETHPNVYFDEQGNVYLRAFRSKVVDGKEILITNPGIKTEKDCTLYGKGEISHSQIIPGSELWDNGSSSSMQHRETICAGDPKTKIVLIMSAKDVIDIELKPQGNGVVANIANATDAEKRVMLEQLVGKDKAAEMLGE